MKIRKYLLIALMIALVPPAFAQNKTFLSMMSFVKGLNTQASPYIIGEDAATVAQNVRFNDVYGGIAKRKINLLYGTIGSFSVEGLCRYYKADGTKRLIAAGSTKLFVGNDSTGAFQTIGTGFNDGKKWQFATYKDVAIGMNGYDNAIKYDGKIVVTANTDGSRTAENLVAELGAPFAELQTGTDLDASAWYQYKIVFYDGSSYWYSTARSNPILTGADVHNITLTNVPIGPTGTTRRYVYRTLGNASRAAVLADTTYYMVEDIANNTTLTFEDNVADGDADADNAPTWATSTAGGLDVTPPQGKILQVHGERIFVSGNNTYPSDVYWSDTFNPDHFLASDYVSVRPDDGDKVTFLKEQLGILTIGKTNSIQKMYTDGDTSTWSVSNPFSFVGCPASYSAANTPEGIYFLSWKGLYKFTGQGSTLISDAVTPQISDILQSNMDKVVGYYYKNEYHLSYTPRETGGTINNRVLVYDLIRDAYSLDTKSIDSFEAFNSGTDFGTLYHGSSKTDGKIYADEGSVSALTKKNKSDFEAGVFDDMRIAGENDPETGLPITTESDFWLELAWDNTIDDASGTIDAATGIIDRPDTAGTWTSPVYEIHASELTQIQWHENLNAYGDATFSVRACDDSACSGESWGSELTNPNGSDLTGLTANTYVQVRISLSTTDIDFTPYVSVQEGYLFRIFYKQAGETKEPSVFSVWKSGWKAFGAPGNKKLLHRMRLFYTGDSGTITVRYVNNEGDVSRSFDVDMSVDPDAVSDDAYTGQAGYKVYEHLPEQNSETDPAPAGEFFMFTIENSGTEDYQILGLEVQYEPLEVY